jgi:hypothetical protein
MSFPKCWPFMGVRASSYTLILKLFIDYDSVRNKKYC